MRRLSKQMKAAVALADISKCRQKHGAVLMKNGVVLAAGTNVSRLSVDEISDENWRSSGIHAEESVIRQAGTAASGATIYVSRIGRSGDIINSRPCKRCQGLAERRGVKKIVHT